MANINPPVTTQLGHADPNASPLTVNELIDLFNTLFHSEIQGDYIPYVIGSDTPSVDDNHKAWIKLDTGGRPIAIMVFYNGNWRRIYNGMPGEIRGYSGNPGFNTNGDFDVNGRGNISGNYDGWQICNGKNGSPNLTDKFVIGAHMDNSSGNTGYSNGWQAVIQVNAQASAQKTGGKFETVLTPTMIPLPLAPPVLMDHYVIQSGGEASEPGGLLFGRPLAQKIELVPQYPPPGYPGGTTGVGPPATFNQVPTTPPFYALAWIIFQGYA